MLKIHNKFDRNIVSIELIIVKSYIINQKSCPWKSDRLELKLNSVVSYLLCDYRGLVCTFFKSYISKAKC